MLFARWSGMERPWYLLAALLTGVFFKLAWTGAGLLPASDGGAMMQVDGRWGSIIALLAGFLVASGNWVLRQGARDWRRVPVEREVREPLAQGTFAPGGRAALISVLLGLLMGTLQLWASGDLAMMLEAQPPTLIAASLVVLLFWTLAVQVGVTFLILIRGFYRLGLTIEPDPLRIEPLAPFSVVGLRILGANTTLCALLVLSVGLGARTQDLLGLTVPLAFSVVISVPCFLLPQLGARNSLRRTRRRMIEQLDRRLAQLGFPAPQALDPGSAHEVATLIDLRARLLDAPDWPVTGLGWLRFTAVLLLPAGSWGLDRLLSVLFG